jgi:outer membrane protein assembly factor BamB
MAKKGVPEWMDEDDLFDDDDLFEDDAAPKGKPSRSGSRRSEPAAEEPKSGRGGHAKSDDEAAEDDGEKKPSLTARLALKHAKRPGEQEVFKSPLVLTLGGGALVLAIMAGAFYFIIGRDTVTRRMEMIEGSIAEERFSQAIKELDLFLVDHPRDKYTESATMLRAKTRIDKEVTGSVPNWAKGNDAIQLYIDECRDFETFGEQYAMLAEVSGKIAVGSLKTAGERKDRSLLEVSEKAKGFLDRFSDPENPPTAKHEEIKVALQLAEASILKHEVTQRSFKEIEDALTRKKPIEALELRRQLINRYKDLESDRKLAGLMTKTLQTERGLVQVEEIDQAASKDERALPVPAPLSLTKHTRASSDETASDATIFAIAQGCCYAFDTVTGDPVWRRSVGMDIPFFPMAVETTIPGVLMFDTTYQELVLLNRLTGELVWRLMLSEQVSGEPLVHNSQVYLPTKGNHLYKIDLQTGHTATRLTFSQPVYSPPVLTRNELHLIVAGDQAMSYTLDVRELTCQQVSFTDQKPGSIDVPMLQLGELMLMIENDRSGRSAQAVLRVFDVTKCEETITERASVRLSGIVRDRPVLRGNRLFVAAVGEQFNVFTVSDDPEKEPLSPIAQPPAQSEYDGSVQLAAGADDVLWKSSNVLLRYELTQDSLKQDQSRKFEEVGATAQPLQTIGSTLFLGRLRQESDAVSVLHIDGESLDAQWESVVGTGINVVMPIRDDAVLALTKAGDVFQVTAANLVAGGFKFQPDGLLDIPYDLDVPLRACVLPNRQIAVARGGEKPHFWLINQAGKIAMDMPLDEAPTGDPVPMAGGAVFPLTSKLRLMGLRTRVEDYLGTVEQNETVQWAHLVPLDEDHIFVVDVEGRLSRLQYRKSPSFHMQQIDSIDLGSPVDVAPLVVGDQLVVTDSTGRTQVLKSNFEQVAEVKLDAPAVGKLAVAGSTVLVETSRGQLRALALTDSLKQLWSLDLKNDHLSGDPMTDGDRIVFGTMNGRVLVLNQATGAIEHSVQLDQPIEHGPLRIGPHLVVTTTDGSLYRIETVLGGAE